LVSVAVGFDGMNRDRNLGMEQLSRGVEKMVRKVL